MSRSHQRHVRDFPLLGRQFVSGRLAPREGSTRRQDQELNPYPKETLWREF